MERPDVMRGAISGDYVSEGDKRLVTLCVKFLENFYGQEKHSRHVRATGGH
jgi:hypothetical protein